MMQVWSGDADGRCGRVGAGFVGPSVGYFNSDVEGLTVSSTGRCLPYRR